MQSLKNLAHARTCATRRLSFLIAVGLAAFAAPAAQAFDYQDHYEFEASLDAPYRAGADHFRTFRLDFRFRALARQWGDARLCPAIAATAGRLRTTVVWSCELSALAFA